MKKKDFIIMDDYKYQGPLKLVYFDLDSFESFWDLIHLFEKINETRRNHYLIFTKKEQFVAVFKKLENLYNDKLERYSQAGHNVMEDDLLEAKSRFEAIERNFNNIHIHPSDRNTIVFYDKQINVSGNQLNEFEKLDVVFTKLPDKWNAMDCAYEIVDFNKLDHWRNLNTNSGEMDTIKVKSEEELIEHGKKALRHPFLRWLYLPKQDFEKVTYFNAMLLKLDKLKNGEYRSVVANQLLYTLKIINGSFNFKNEIEIISVANQMDLSTIQRIENIKKLTEEDLNNHLNSYYTHFYEFIKLKYFGLNNLRLHFRLFWYPNDNDDTLLDPIDRKHYRFIENSNMVVKLEKGINFFKYDTHDKFYKTDTNIINTDIIFKNLLEKTVDRLKKGGREFTFRIQNGIIDDRPVVKKIIKI